MPTLLSCQACLSIKRSKSLARGLNGAEQGHARQLNPRCPLMPYVHVMLYRAAGAMEW